MTRKKAAPIARSNVVRLPTAAPRKINNQARAARQYRESEPAWPGECMLPVEADTKAITVHRSPELLIALCILKALSPEQRHAAQDAVHWAAFIAKDDTSHLASMLVARIGGAS